MSVLHNSNRLYTPPAYKKPTTAELMARPIGLEFSPPVESVERWRGYRLPLRVEFNIDEPNVFYELIDADHRRVDVDGDFDQLRELMFAANATARRYNAYRGMVSRGANVSHVERLSNLHPCDPTPVRIGLAFECLIFQYGTDWITNLDLFDLEGFGVLNADMTPTPLRRALARLAARGERRAA